MKYVTPQFLSAALGFILLINVLVSGIAIYTSLYREIPIGICACAESQKDSDFQEGYN